jgi:lipocalin
MGLDNLTANYNLVKDEVIRALEREGHLNKKANEVAGDYVVVLHEADWYGRMWMKAQGIDPKKDGKALRIMVAKSV